MNRRNGRRSSRPRWRILESYERVYPSKDASRPVIVVRRASRSDVPDMMRNLQSVASEQVYIGTEGVTLTVRRNTLQNLRDKRCLTIIAKVDGKTVGSLTLYHHGILKMRHVRWLGMLVIDGYREIGVGSALMDYALNWAKQQKDIEKVELAVFSTNMRALGLYEKFGFKVEGILKKQHILKGKYADEIRMSVFVK